MNHRLTIAAAVAVILASASEWVLINGAAWLFASIGAVIVVAAAGTLTRLAPNHAAIGATVLAAIVSVPLLADSSLLLKLAGVAIIACCAASASRVRAFSPIADVVTYLAALLLYLNLILSHAKSWALVIPTAGSLRHLATLANWGSAIAKNTPPVQGRPGVVLLAAASIGLAAAVIDLIAVRLNKPAIAGLPLLVLYMAPIATAAKPSGVVSAITFLLAATGYLGLLASDGRNRLRGWGRIVTVWHYAGEDDRLGGADVRGLAATGRRIGVAAVCAAVIAPLLLPTLNLHRLFANHGSGTNVVDAGLPNAILELRTLLTASVSSPVLSYQSNNGNPGEYLQVYVLNYVPSGGDWQVVSASPSITVGPGTLRPPPGLAATIPTRQITTNIALDHVVGASPGYNFSVFFLPVPYWPESLSLQGAWSEADDSLMVYSSTADHSGMHYTVTSGEPNLNNAEEDASANAQIPSAISRKFLPFPSPVTRQLTRIARKVTKGADTPFEKAKALEYYFQNDGFVYTTQVGNLGNGPRGLLTFLTTDKQGFCVQFAFAMAVLARLVGIPSRIAVGYTPGREHAGAWQVTTGDAHAWPELYFPELGWLRFEPTPGGPNGQGTARQPSYAIGRSGNKINLGGTRINSSQKGNKPGGRQTGGGHAKHPTPTGPQSSQATSPISPRSFPVDQILFGVLALLVFGAAVPGTARIIARRRRWRAAHGDAALANAAWQEVCADLADFGFARPLSESPRATARRIGLDADIDDSARHAIRRIAAVVERCRYAPVPASADGIRADVKQVRRSLARSSGLVTRLRASLLPASVMGPVFEQTRQTVAQRTGWLPLPS
jgi:transglutaminase-like putative cysteine protease